MALFPVLQSVPEFICVRTFRNVAFGEKLMPVIQQAGLKPDQPVVFPAHNFVSQ